VNRDQCLDRARAVLDIELDGIRTVRDRLDDAFAQAVATIASRRGKLIVVGVGKSGIVGRKLAATMTSTGTPAVFLHAGEGLHGDLGIVQRGDVALVLSYSGASAEVVALATVLTRLQVPIVAMTGVADSALAQAAAVVLDIAVPQEACPMGLAPTASTTAALALGDALALVLLDEAGFGPDDFAHLHPAGRLGARLRRVGDLMHTGAALPVVHQDTPVPEALVEMSSKRLGVTAVTDSDGALVGVISDGDLRRSLVADAGLMQRRAAEVMTAAPKTIDAAALAAAAVTAMETHKITVLFAVDSDGRPLGAVHLHDLLRAGVR